MKKAINKVLIKELIVECKQFLEGIKQQNKNSGNSYTDKLFKEADEKIDDIANSQILFEDGHYINLNWSDGYAKDNYVLYKEQLTKDLNVILIRLRELLGPDEEEPNIPLIKNAEQKNRVFISHSSKDNDFVIKLSQFFELLGIDRNNIFCSSIEGQGVKHGNKIEAAVRNEIIEDKILVFVITDNFMKSNYCLNELGAGWILADERTQNKHLFHIKLPDIKFDDIRGFIGSGDKCTELNDKSMTTFVEELEEALNIPGKKATEYRNLVDNFINDTKAFSDAAVKASKLSEEDQKKKEMEKLKNVLRKTNEPERKIIRQIYKSNSGEATLNPTSATVKALEHKQILFTAAGYYDYLNPRSSYTFHPWVYEALKEDKQLETEIIGGSN